MLEAPKEGEWGLVVREEYFPLVRQAGFDTVRVPIRWSAHALRQPPYTIAPEFFQRIDWVIENALQNDLNVVINMHHYEELFKDLEGERERFLVLWDQIATRYRNLPPEVLFEPLNEPHGALDNESWEELFKQVLAVIRRTNPHRNVIFTGADMGTLNGLLQAKRPNDDPHLIATFHYYLPFAFTHQGAEWVEGSSAWLGTLAGGATARSAPTWTMTWTAPYAGESRITCRSGWVSSALIAKPTSIRVWPGPTTSRALPKRAASHGPTGSSAAASAYTTRSACSGMSRY